MTDSNEQLSRAPAKEESDTTLINGVGALVMEGCVPLYIYDSDGVVLEANRAGAELLGYDTGQVEGCLRDDFIYDSLNRSLIEEAWASIRTEGVWVADIVLRNVEGRPVPLKLSVQHLEEADAMLVTVLGPARMESGVAEEQGEGREPALLNSAAFTEQLEILCGQLNWFGNGEACLALLELNTAGGDGGLELAALEKQTAGILLDSIRDTDCAAALGDSRFALLLPATRLEEAGILLERIRGAVCDTLLEDGSSPLQLSAGAVALGKGVTDRNAMAAAEKRLAGAIAEGGNLVFIG